MAEKEKLSNQDISKKYIKLSDIEHVLHRPGMYVGSIKSHPTTSWLLIDERFKECNVTYNPGFLKLFDEIISNSVDEHKRNPKLNKIEVTIDKEQGIISVWDNGGIPVIQHTVHGEWIPEFVFSNLKAGTNFDDTQKRDVAGTNGVGAVLTNIFSLEFKVETADGKNKFTQIFSQNMHKRSVPMIEPCKQNFTRITYKPEFSRFGMTKIDLMHMSMLRKRIIDVAACNTKIEVSMNGEKFMYPSFREYCKLYTKIEAYEIKAPNWKIGVGCSRDGFKSISFVNSIETKDGGTHVDYIINQITSWLKEKIKKKHKIELKPSEIRSQMILFVDSTIINPAFSAQTKEKLITEQKDFGSVFTISEIFLEAIFNSEIVKSILDWAKQKSQVDEKRAIRDLNKNLSKSKIVKLIDAKSKVRNNCSLSVFEGDAALGAFRDYRDAQLQGAFPLRGKFINVSDETNAKVMQNEEVKGLMSSVNLKMGEQPSNLYYGQIRLYTDADPDGDGIAGLLINFLMKYWPALFEQGRVFRVATPLLVATKQKDIVYFYSNEEYEEWLKKTPDVKKWSIAYKKGLASLTDFEYEQIIKNPRLLQLTKDDMAVTNLTIWFTGDSDKRKAKILGHKHKVIKEVKLF
jgi:DNA topoisomerase-2